MVKYYIIQHTLYTVLIFEMLQITDKLLVDKFAFFVFLLVLLNGVCAEDPVYTRPPGIPPGERMYFALPEPIIHFEPEPPAVIIPEYIMGRGLIPHDHLVEFLHLYNPETGEFAAELARMYIEEAYIEEVNHDIAFAQMCLETGYLRFGGLVTPDMNNFCGLGSTGPGNRGEVFPDARTGVRAHIQHLKAYASEEPLNQELVDPRFFWINYGFSPKIRGLSGTWAEDPLYAEKISGILRRLYTFSVIKGNLTAKEQVK